MLLEGNASAKEAHELEQGAEKRSTVVVNASVKLSEEEAIEFLNDATLVSTYALLEIDDFRLTAVNLSQRLNISRAEAETAIEKLINLGLIEETGVKDKYISPVLCFDDPFITSSDLLSLFVKFSQTTLAKITSKDIFSYRYQAMSKKTIQKYQPEIEKLLSKIASESLAEADCEVYATGFSFTKATRARKER